MQRKLTIMTSKHPSSLLAWLFVMLPILTFFSACSNNKAGDEKKAYALFLEAINHNAAGDKKLAITLIDSALQMNAADTTRSWLTCEKTTALVDLGKLKEATAIGKNGILFAEKIKDEEGMMGMCGSLGICYRRLGDLDSSLFYYKKGLETAIESQNTEYEIYLNNCISVLFNEQKRYREAIEYSDKAENKAIATNDTIERLSAHANKGAIFMRQGLYRKSIDFLTPLWGMVKEANYNVLTLKYLSPLLKSYLALGKTDSVMHYMAYADEACRNLGPTSNGILGILEIKAQMLGKQKKYAEQSILLDSISRFNNVNMAMPQDKLFATQAECLYNLGKTHEAYPSRTALEVYRIVQESVSNAIKYGYSKMITVTLDASNNQASLCIANDISPEHPITQGKMGIGKDTLKMRTEALKAILTISEQDEEYKVEVRFPL